MRAGELRHPITIEEFTTSSDVHGGVTKTWSTFATMRAAIWPQKSREEVVDGKTTLIDRTVIRTRYIDGVTKGMRVVKDDGSVLEIIGIKNHDERNRILDLTCKAYG